LNNLNNKSQNRQIQSASAKDRDKSLGVQNQQTNNSQEPNKRDVLRQQKGSQSRP